MPGCAGVSGVQSRDGVQAWDRPWSAAWRTRRDGADHDSLPAAAPRAAPADVDVIGVICHGERVVGTGELHQGDDLVRRSSRRRSVSRRRTAVSVIEPGPWWPAIGMPLRAEMSTALPVECSGDVAECGHDGVAALQRGDRRVEARRREELERRQHPPIDRAGADVVATHIRRGRSASPRAPRGERRRLIARTRSIERIGQRCQQTGGSSAAPISSRVGSRNRSRPRAISASGSTASDPRGRWRTDRARTTTASPRRPWWTRPSIVPAATRRHGSDL